MVANGNNSEIIIITVSGPTLLPGGKWSNKSYLFVLWTGGNKMTLEAEK